MCRRNQFRWPITSGMVLAVLLLPVASIYSAASAQTIRENQAKAASRNNAGRIDSLSLHDNVRGKDLVCRITYPATVAGSAPCPILIFSHGAMGSKDNYDYVVDYLAAHGYVCIQPSHEDALKAMPPAGRLLKAREIIRSLPANAGAWDNRARDISFIIDSLPLIQKQLPVSMDLSRIACGGHSLGAFTTALVTGAEPPPPATRKDYLDKRISAALMMSPQVVRKNESDFGFADLQAWKRLTVPCLFLSGPNDTTKWASFEDRKQAFLNCPAGNKYFATIQGASHMTFAGRSGDSLFGGETAFGHASRAPEGNLNMMTADIDRVCCCFLDAFLKKEAGAKSRLTAANSFGGLVDIKSR